MQLPLPQTQFRTSQTQQQTSHQQCTSQVQCRIHKQRRQSAVCSGNSASGGVNWPSSSHHSLVAELFKRGQGDCGSSTCGVVPAGSIVLVREDTMPVTHEDVVHALERGILVSGDRSIFVGSRHTKQINCILESPLVSDRHARLELVTSDDPWWFFTSIPRPSDKLYVTDLGSKHGTTVNRVPLVPCMPTELQPGDVVTFGDTSVQYRVVRATPRQSAWFPSMWWATT